MSKRILKGLCKCLECNYAFTYVSDSLLVCSGYRTKKVCKYISYKEDDILDILEQHFHRRGLEFKHDNEYLKQYVNKMYLGENGNYRIEFSDNSIASFDGCSLLI